MSLEGGVEVEVDFESRVLARIAGLAEVETRG